MFAHGDDATSSEVIGGYVMQQELPDFDTLKELAEQDPKALEDLRQQFVDELIASASPDIQRRLRGIQFQIDAQRRIHKNPMAACIKLSAMMHESFSELRYLLNDVAGQGPESPKPAQADTEQPLAQVLDFNARRSG